MIEWMNAMFRLLVIPLLSLCLSLPPLFLSLSLSLPLYIHKYIIKLYMYLPNPPHEQVVVHGQVEYYRIDFQSFPSPRLVGKWIQEIGLEITSRLIGSNLSDCLSNLSKCWRDVLQVTWLLSTWVIDRSATKILRISFEMYRVFRKELYPFVIK